MELYSEAKLFAESQWQKVVNLFGADEKMIICLGTSLVLLLPFVFVNSFFLYLDVTGKPSWLVKYKIRKEKNPKVDKKHLIRCIKLATFNEVMACVILYLCYPLLKARGVWALNPLPDIWVPFVQYYLLGYLDEVLIYYGHRLLHWKPFYKRFHRIHHQWTTPISLATSYGHPLDSLVGALYGTKLTILGWFKLMPCLTLLKLQKVFPMLLQFYIFRPHVIVMWFYLGLGQIDAYIHHSNYHFPFVKSPQFHDYHHFGFTECFGASGLLDSFHETDKKFRSSVQGKRDVTFYSLTPIDELIPEEKKDQ